MKKKPFVTKEQLDEIMKKYPTPFHLYDEKGIRKNMQALKEAFAWNPGECEGAEGSFCVEQGLQGVLCGKGDSQPFSDQHLKRLRLWM